MSEPTPEADKPATEPMPRSVLRRRLMIGAPLLAVGGLSTWAWRCQAKEAATTVKGPGGLVRDARFEFAVNTVLPGTPVNRRVLGSNVQWPDNGNDMLGADFQFEPTMLQLAQQLAPTVLRYPGGAQSDGYHWAAGMGPQSGRGPNNHVNANTQQITRFGTGELLELCEATGAVPLITVNVVTGTADEAAQWLKAVNVTRLVSSRTGRQLPRVEYWEIGNEPYLKQENRPDLDIAPALFAQRANETIRALRAVDASIKIGLPLTQDKRNGVPVTPYPGFSAQVLALVTESFDYVSVHDAYMPFALDAVGDATRQYWAAMAAARAVQADLAANRAMLAQLRPGSAYPLAVTEYSPLFTLGAGDNDNWITTPAGALYTADVLRVFATTPEVVLANQWSLSGNWKFGAIHSDQAGVYPRPVYEAMRLFGEALRGELLPAPDVRVERISTTAAGLVPATQNLPLLEVMVTREAAAGGGKTVRTLLIQKDPTRRAGGRISIDAASAATLQSATLTVLACTNVFDASDAPGVVTRSTQVLPVGRTAAATEFSLPPCSIALLTQVFG